MKDISIIVAAHTEGLIAHKTMRSIARACKSLDARKISYEVIITIDNGDDTTLHYFKNQKVIPAHVHTISFKDLGASRNFGVTSSAGRYIATIDADDLVSENWFADAYTYLEKLGSKAVVHTSHSINFGTTDILWEKFDSRSKAEDALIMVQANRWDSAIMAPREIFESFPYQPNTLGFGSEDWHFNSQTLAAGIPHLVIPKTILFVRRKDVSEMTIQAKDKRTVHYTDLLDFDFIRTLNTTVETQHTPSQSSQSPIKPLVKKALTKGTRIAYQQLIKIPATRSALQKAKSTLKSVAQPAEQRFPSWLVSEWRAIHAIEKETFPSQALLAHIPVYHSEMYELGHFYTRIVRKTTKLPDYIIFVPYLQKGGADLVAINYAHTIKKLRPDWHIAVVATENKPSPWANRLDPSIDFIPFGEIAGNLPEPLKLQVLARFLVQSKCTRLHIIQSPLAFAFVEAYSQLIRGNGYKVYACAFCEDEDNEGRIAGHVHSGLPYAYPNITKILTDNNAISDLLVNEYAFDPSRFTTHYQPVSSEYTWNPPADGPFRILWAGRIAKQKRPDLLIDIASHLDPAKFRIDVYGSFQDGLSAEMFSNSAVISYKGAFDGLLTLPLDTYHLYLYTSENDGLPNTLLEVASKGLPTVASDIGGIGELVVDNKSGRLIAPFDVPAKYAQAIEGLAHDRELLAKLSKGAYAKIQSDHTPSAFEKHIAQDIL